MASGLGLGAIYGMSGVGLVVLYRASGTFNFAFGALGALSAHCAWSLIQIGTPVAPAWIAGVVVAAFCSWFYGWAVSSQLIDRDRSVRAIATLGLALFLLGVVTTIWGPGLPRRLSLPIDNQVVAWIAEATRIRISYTRVLALAFAVLAIVGVATLLERTRLGLAMRALASNRAVSSLIGIPAPRVRRHSLADFRRLRRGRWAVSRRPGGDESGAPHLSGDPSDRSGRHRRTELNDRRILWRPCRRFL